MQSPDIAADKIIEDHVAYASAAGFIPLPLADVVAVTAVQIDMLRQLANHYGVDYSADMGKGVITSLLGSSLSRLGASAIKAIPVVGTFLGGASMAVLSGASTYGLGKVFKKHFSEGGDLLNLDMLKAKFSFKKAFEEGKGVVSRKEKKEDAMDKLERLATLKDKGFITEEDYQKQKERLLNMI